MAELATLARPYANAAFDVAKSDGELDRWSRMLALLGAAAGDEGIGGAAVADAPQAAYWQVSKACVSVIALAALSSGLK